MLGYDTSVYWRSAALASVMLMHALAKNKFSKMLSTLLAVYQCTEANVCGYMRTVQSDTHQWFSTKAFIEHAKAAAGAKTEVELSALIADYMNEERRRFQARTDEYFRQAKETERLSETGARRYESARAALDRLARPDDPLPEGA